MSMDVYRYRATCGACGHEGVEVRRSHEDASESSTWDGFDFISNDPYLVLRQRVPPYGPVCACGSRDVQRGVLLAG